MIHTNTSRRVKSVLLAIVLAFTTLTQGCQFTDKQDFTSFTRQLFVAEVSANTMTLHYTLADPASYGIHDYEVSLGSPASDSSDGIRELNDLKSRLESFDKNELSKKDSLTLDTLVEYIKTRLKLSRFSLFDDPLLPSGGDAGQLPLLFAQFPLKNSRDVTDYLTMLGQMDTYLNEILNIEKQRAQKGVFMSKNQLLTVTLLLKKFITPVKNHFLAKSFEKRLKSVKLSAKMKKIYIRENIRLIKEVVFPSYQSLVKGIKSLKKKCGTDVGLCSLTNGKKYYKALLASYTGCKDSADELMDRINTSRDQAIANASLISLDHPELFASGSFTQSTPFKKIHEMTDTDMVKTLIRAIKKDFPAAPDFSCRIEKVDRSLKDYLAPAFYITSPIDNYKDNTIYINSASDYADIHYFTTLAHEGLPGHLYQTVMSNSYGLDPIRALPDFPGYIEGWATYVELMSYNYAGLPSPIAKVLMYQQIAMISLYATSDLGIHYYGWNDRKLYDFWSTYGVKDHRAVDEIKSLILADPCNYLKYYVGFLNFMKLRDQMKDKLGSAFSLKKFHSAVLKMGPTSFPLLKKYFKYFY